MGSPSWPNSTAHRSRMWSAVHERGHTGNRPDASVPLTQPMRPARPHDMVARAGLPRTVLRRAPTAQGSRMTHDTHRIEDSSDDPAPVRSRGTLPTRDPARRSPVPKSTRLTRRSPSGTTWMSRTSSEGSTASTLNSKPNTARECDGSPGCRARDPSAASPVDLRRRR